MNNSTTIKHVFICLWAVVFVGCSSTRQLERKMHREVYTALGVEQGRKDNFELYKELASWLQTPHVDGGMTHSGIDCSGLVYLVYKNVYGKILERNSTSILKKNCDEITKSRLRAGDLVFFNTAGKSKSTINHVGIYLKNNKFIHSSTSKGVMVSSLDEKYFQKSWVCAAKVKHYR